MNAAQRPLAKLSTPSGDLVVSRDERMLASAAYLAALAGFWLIVPAVLYFWKGRQSRFLGFHAVQAVMLQVALIPITTIGVGVAAVIVLLLEGIGGKMGGAVAALIFFFVIGIALMIPAAATLWMGLCALRGQPRKLPLLGRWASRVVDVD
jgi:uncharacterized membrane protein